MKTVSELFKTAKASGLSKLEKDQWKVRSFQAYKTDQGLLFEIPVHSFNTFETYTTHIHLVPIQFTTEDKYKTVLNVGRIKLDGVYYYYVLPTLYSTAQVSCTCANYKYTWAYYNAGVGSHYGELPHIDPPKGLRPPRNPQHLPGMCKHLYNAFNATRGFTNCELPDY